MTSDFSALNLPRFAQDGFAYKRIAQLFALVLAATSSACGQVGDGAGDTPTIGNVSSGDSEYALPLSCELDDMKSWVEDNMNDYYLFYDQVEQNVALDEFNDLQDLITWLRVQPFDTFSYISDETEYTSRYTEGETFGFGWRLSRTDQDEFFFKLIERYSPLAEAGVERGDQWLAINGIAMADFVQQSSEQINATLGVDDESVTLELSIGKPTGATQEVSVTKSSYPLETVLDTQSIEHNGSNVGYLHFYQFIDTSAAELETAFTQLAAANVNELVLDLRYNGGGRVVIANELASYVAGNGKTDLPFATYRPNDKYTENAVSINFVDQAQALNLSRVFVLQSEDTCSASELVVNGLRPFMEVITVGETSCGKPYASTPRVACGKVMSALELESVNADGAGGYYDGIAADCAVSEDISQPLGNASENLLKAALDYATMGNCETLAARTSTHSSLPLPPQLRAPQVLGSTF